MERLAQKLKLQKKRTCKLSRQPFNGILNIFHRSGPRAPDPYPDPKTGSSSLFFRRMTGLDLYPLPMVYTMYTLSMVRDLCMRNWETGYLAVNIVDDGKGAYCFFYGGGTFSPPPPHLLILDS